MHYLERIWLETAAEEFRIDDRDPVWMATGPWRRRSAHGLSCDGRPDVPGVVFVAIHQDGRDGEIYRQGLAISTRAGASACLKALLSAWPDLRAEFAPEAP